MKNSIVSILFFLLILFTSYSNYRVFISFHEQLILMTEWNSFQKNLSPDIVDNFNYKYPNTTMTSMPLSFLVGRYFIENDEKKAIELMRESDNSNKYLGSHYTELSNYYSKKGFKDSLMFYSKKAYYQLPINIHFKNYMDVFKQYGTENDLDSAFNYIKHTQNEYKWRMFLFNKINRYMTESNKDSILSIVGEAESFFKDKKSIDILRNFIQVGADLEFYSEILLQANSDFDAGNFLKAADNFLKLNLMDPQERTHLYNVAICYFKLKSFDEAIIFFNRYLDEFGDTSGKTEFYIASSYLENNEVERGCEFLDKSLQKGFNTSNKLIEVFCN